MTTTLNSAERLEESVYRSLLDHGHTHGPNVETYTIPLHELRDAIRAGLSALRSRDSVIEGTPSSRWKAEGKEDPHDNRYDCERSRLCRGNLTDDEIANAVYLDPNIGNLTAAKDRIRWLSRALERALSSHAETAGMVLVAKNADGEIRAMMRLDGDNCLSVAETLREWHAVDAKRTLHLLPATAMIKAAKGGEM